MANLRCDHCLLTVPEGSAICDEINGQKKIFCCNGCRGIYRLIYAEGLDEFYHIRTGWRPGPPEDIEIDVGLFQDSVRMTGNTAEMDINLGGIRCASCIWLIEHSLMKLHGLVEVRVNYATHRARVQWQIETIGLDAILKKIRSLGYAPRPYTASDIEEQLKKEKKDLLIRFGTASFFSMQLMLYTTGLYAGYFQGIDPLYKRIFEVIAWLLATPVMFYCGYPFLKNSVKGIRNRAVNMDTLIFMGSFSAYGYSIIMIFTGGEVYFDTSAMIITLILLGRFIETGARVKTTGAIASLINLQPKKARLIKDASPDTRVRSVDVPASDLKAGDLIEVIPGDRVPVDCTVVEGLSEVDESMLSGESMPVQKSEGSEVFAGTMNLNGRLLLKATTVGTETVLARIIRAVEDSLSRKPPIQSSAEKTVRWFVPAILLLSAGTFFFWFLREGMLASSLMNAISVLVIACPCALGLATPLAVLTGTSSLYSRGILVKGGDIIEVIARTDFVCLDKTGTVTTGRPALTHTLPYGIDKGELHILASSLEQGSEHSLARALRNDLHEKDLLPVKDFRAVPGRGVEGVVENTKLVAGNPAFLRSCGVTMTDSQMRDFNALSSGGNTVIGLSVETDLKGWFVVSDKMRAEVPEVVEDLKKSGFQILLLTGDNRIVAHEIGKKAGISTIDAEVLPLGKAEKIRQIKETGHRVIMVGDGINDAPALIEADAGVTIGSATDIALESADAVLMRNDLRLVPHLIKTSRKTLSVIEENLFWAFSYNLIALPLAVSGKIHPIVSAACMALSSLIVVGNSLRLYTLITNIDHAIYRDHEGS